MSVSLSVPVPVPVLVPVPVPVPSVSPPDEVPGTIPKQGPTVLGSTSKHGPTVDDPSTVPVLEVSSSGPATSKHELTVHPGVAGAAANPSATNIEGGSRFKSIVECSLP